MRYEFVAVHEIMGIARPKDSQEQVLVDYPSDRAQAVIYPDMDSRLFEHDRSLVISNMMLDGFIGKASAGTFEERLAHDLSAFQEKRREEAKERLFVLFEAQGEIESFNPQVQKEFPEFFVAVGSAPKDDVRARYRPQINALLAGIAIGSENVTGIKKIRDGVVFASENDKPVYAYNITMSGTGTVVTYLEGSMLAFTKDNAKVFARHQDLVNPARLLTRSLDVENDTLLSFLSAWSGLEIFINGCFRAYENSLFEKLHDGEKPLAPSKLVERIRDVMKDKYGLSNKFALVSLELDGASTETDIADFQRVKRVRDSLIHGEEVPLDALPTKDVRRLLRKYLKLHTEHLKLRE